MKPSTYLLRMHDILSELEEFEEEQLQQFIHSLLGVNELLEGILEECQNSYSQSQEKLETST